MEGADAFAWLPPSTLGSLVAIVADGVLVVDASGTVLAVNDAFGRLCGHEPWEIEGMSAAVLAVDGFDDFLDHALRVLEDVPSWSGRTSLRRRDGATIECDTWMSRVDVDAGEVFVAAHREVEVQRRYGDTFLQEVEARIHELVNSLAALRGYVALLDSLPEAQHAEVRERLTGLTVSTATRLENLLAELRRS